MNKMQDAYIVAALRTPVGKASRGVFQSVRPDDLLSHVIKGLFANVPAIPPSLVEDVIIGCAMPEGSQGMNVARIASLMAGIPNTVPAMTLNRFCSSGLQSIATARNKIALGEADVVIAGGVESMSQVPLGGYHYSANPKWFQDPEMKTIAFNMGITAEKVAEKWSISREAQDAFALRSHERALKAQRESSFDAEILPYKLDLDGFDYEQHAPYKKSFVVKQDEGPRQDANLEALTKLKPVFKLGGSVTAGNTSQTSDGAAALLMVSERILAQYDLQPLARFKGFQVAGLAPETMGMGPVHAIPKVLKQVGLSMQDLSWIELNEAFAAQALAVMQELDLDPNCVNPLGGAIALGHPLGATGAIRACTLIHGMRRLNLQYGLVTMCIGTGMGAAGVFEVL